MTKYVSSENLSYFYTKLKALLDTKLDASKAYSHPNSGVTAGTYRSVTVNAQGHVTAGTNPTTLAGYGITDAAAKTHTHNYAGSSSAGGAATSALKLTTARTISLGTAATGSVSFDGSGNVTLPVTDLKEAYLTWGGRNYAGTFGALDAALVPDLGANRLAYGSGEGITIEYSRDSGATWTAYTTDTATKAALLGPLGGSFTIGKSDSTTKCTATCQLRITLDTDKIPVYTEFKKFAIYASTNYANDCWLTLDASLESTPTTFKTFADKVTISGWSGWNIINTSLISYGNSKEAQYGLIRFTFGCKSVSSSVTSGLTIYRIMGFGGVGWTTPSNMAKYGTLYKPDNSQKAIFPGTVEATLFNGKATSATNDSSNQKITSTYIKGLSASGRTITITKGDGTTSTITTQDTTYSTGTASTSGLTKLYTGTGTATDGTMTQNAINTALNGKANSSHTHQSADIISLDAAKLTGTISIDRLPAGALERCIVVADDTARKALTTAKAQTGDTVKVTSTGLMYMIVDDTKLNSDAGYIEYTAGSAASVDWSGVKNHPTTVSGYGITDAALKDHTHLYAGSTSAGGAAKSVANNIAIKLNGGTTEGTNLFTYNGSAAKTINITPSAIGAAAASHTHSYAGSASAGGSATSAVKLDTATAGSATQPVYFTGGKPVACTYTLAKSVPADANFSNTWRGVQDNLTSTATDQSLSANQGKVLKGLIDGKAQIHKWTATVKCATWSRLAYIAYGANTSGSSFLVNVRATRGSVVYNETFAISVNHSSKASISKVSTAAYSSIQIRVCADSSGNCYVELYDNANSATNATTQSVLVTVIPFGIGAITPYTAFTDGTTLATNFTAAKTLATNTNSLQGNLTWGEITSKPTLGTASTKAVRTLSAAGPSGWKDAATDDGYVPTMSFMAYWNGAYSGTSSNLAYCNKGAFGTIVTKNSGDYSLAGHTHSYAGSSSAGGAATSAVKLQTARTITLGGDLTGNTTFDGSANVTLNATITAMTNTEIDALFA